MAENDAYDVQRRRNDVAVADYFASTAFSRWRRDAPTTGRRDAPSPKPGGVATARFEALGRLREAERALGRARGRRERERTTLDGRWARLGEDQTRFREDFVGFDKFVRENDHKRQRAARKILDKDDLSRIYDSAIWKLRRDCRDLEGLITAMDSNIEKYHIYEDFLDEVVRTYPKHFTTVADVVERFVTLTETRGELQKFQNESFGRLDELRKATATIVDRHSVDLIGLEARLASLRTASDRSASKCLEVESALDSVLVEARSIVLETVEVEDSCSRIYREMRSRRGDEAPEREPDASRRLEYVKSTLGRYRKVNEAIEAAKGEEARASEAAGASRSGDVRKCRREL